MIINVNPTIDKHLEDAKRSAYNLFEKYNGSEKADIQRRLQKLDARLNRYEHSDIRDDFERHDLLQKYLLAADDCRKDTVSGGGFWSRVQKLFA